MAAQRVQRQQPRPAARYKIETVDEGLGDEKGTTQIVIQTTSAPQATIVQQQPQQQPTQIQTQQLQTGTTTTATLVTTNKRSAQRSNLAQSSSAGVKRTKTANVMDPLESETGTTATTTTQQIVPQQITVQTTVVSAAEKLPQSQVRQQQQQQEEAEYIDLPMEINTKSEPDYTEDHGDAAGDAEGPYVEDDAYGDMRYDDSYFTENEDAGNQAANTSGGAVSATTSKAVVKQQSYSDSSFVEGGADQSTTEAQGWLNFYRSLSLKYFNYKIEPESKMSNLFQKFYNILASNF